MGRRGQRRLSQEVRDPTFNPRAEYDFYPGDGAVVEQLFERVSSRRTDPCWLVEPSPASPAVSAIRHRC